MTQLPPEDIADHAADFARRYAPDLDRYVALRMDELGVPGDLIGADDLRANMKWCAFDPVGRQGGNITGGVTVNSGVLNPELLRGRKGGKAWAEESLKSRIDAVIAHELAEYQTGSHEKALEAAARTELPVTKGARRILKGMAR